MLSHASARLDTDVLPLGIKLMPHQKAMVYRMIEVEKAAIRSDHPYAMMSDKPGAGKSYAILSFLYVTNKIMFKAKRPHVNMIVVPYNICTQWHGYMHKMYGTDPRAALKYKCLTEYQDIMTLYVEPTTLLGYDVLLTTSLYFDMIAKTVKSLGLTIERAFFDEADTIKNLLQTPLKCNMTWFVSASIHGLFGNSERLSIGSYNVRLSSLKSSDVTCDPDFVNESIVLPPPVSEPLKCALPAVAVFGLLCAVYPQHRRRFEAMDYTCIRSEHVHEAPTFGNEGGAAAYVYQDMVGRIRDSEHKIPMLEEDCVRVQKKQDAASSKEDAESFGRQLLEIKQAIKALHERIEHSTGVMSMFQRFMEGHGIQSDSVLAKWTEGTGKLDVLKSHVDRVWKGNPDYQCIVFSDFDPIYVGLREHMSKQSIRYRDLDGGNMTTMDAIIQEYKARRFQVLLADSSMYSCGMNLENTSEIVFVHAMDAMREKQVVGRAHRYGREGTLKIVHVLY